MKTRDLLIIKENGEKSSITLSGLSNTIVPHFVSGFVIIKERGYYNVPAMVHFHSRTHDDCVIYEEC